jgi:hypothetical protein
MVFSMNDALRDAAIKEFNDNYLSPVGELAHDSAEGGYVWITTEWDTRDALNDLFGEDLSEAAINEIVAQLEDEATSWLNREEWNNIDK